MTQLVYKLSKKYLCILFFTTLSFIYGMFEKVITLRYFKTLCLLVKNYYKI